MVIITTLAAVIAATASAGVVLYAYGKGKQAGKGEGYEMGYNKGHKDGFNKGYCGQDSSMFSCIPFVCCILDCLLKRPVNEKPFDKMPFDKMPEWLKNVGKESNEANAQQN